MGQLLCRTPILSEYNDNPNLLVASHFNTLPCSLANISVSGLLQCSSKPQHKSLNTFIYVLYPPPDSRPCYHMEVTCPVPANVPHGFFKYVGNTVTYSCEHGYYLLGKECLTCLVTGKWDGLTPRCLPSARLPGQVGELFSSASLHVKAFLKYSRILKFCLLSEKAKFDSVAIMPSAIKMRYPYVLHVGHQGIQVPWDQRDQKVIQVQMEKEELQAFPDYLDVKENKVHQATLDNLDQEVQEAPEEHLGLKVKMVLMEGQ
eukprot:g46479.t1